MTKSNKTTWQALALVILILCSSACVVSASDSPDREIVLAKLKAINVGVLGLTMQTKEGGPQINLGLGADGSVANNANDETLRLIAQLPELEGVALYYGKFSKDGLAVLPDVFSVLNVILAPSAGSKSSSQLAIVSQFPFAPPPSQMPAANIDAGNSNRLASQRRAWTEPRKKHGDF